MPNRYICNVLDEMRSCVKTGNYSYLPGLIEEAQSMANSMEARIYDIHDWERLNKDLKKLRKEVEGLEERKEELEESAPKKKKK